MRRFQIVAVAILLTASCSSEKSDPEALCDLLTKSEELNDLAESIPLDDPIEVAQNMTLYVELFENMVEVAPKSISSDLETVHDFMAEVRDAKELAAGDRVVEIAAIQRARDEAIGLQAATARISAYARNECGIEL